MMTETAKLAGFFAAHAIWCVSEGETLIPMLGAEDHDGRRKLLRFESEELQDAVAQGKEMFEKNPEGVLRAVLIYDGYIPLPTGKTDALIIEARNYQSLKSLTIAIPYRPSNTSRGFAVHRPKFLSFENAEPNMEKLGTDFFAGVDQHEKGSAVWSDFLDESI